MTDEKILDLLEHKPEEGAKLLMEKYLPAVRNVCAKRLCDQEDVKECVNDVFAEFCLKYPKYDIEKGNIKNYLCTIAKRRSVDKYRKNSRNKETEYKIYEQYKEEIDERDSREEMSRRLDEAMEKLEPLDREILEMYYYEGFSYTEIAKELNLNYETVKKSFCI